MKVNIANSKGGYDTRELTQQQLDKLIHVAEVFGKNLGYSVILK